MQRQGQYAHKTISLIVPHDLLAQIDSLAKQNFASRSDIIRRAAIKFINDSGLRQEEVSDAHLAKVPEQRRENKKGESQAEYDYEALAKKYPYVQVGDRELLRFLDDMDNGRL
jgi:metal-responsive CopG/Arc/MetJ family transcriptional regulator